MANILLMSEVFKAIAEERQMQDKRWGAGKPQSLPGYLVLIEAELAEAKFGWCKNMPGKSAPLNELVQLGALVVACLERYGVEGSARATNDVQDCAESRMVL